ncbi:hypothetical protein B0T16DRAFT_457997 [Cercophora newfieldiana]|uniref:LysM domain-containing protein n=1 Tax=Cercophora newfieldiana TaxID=92897 RepID=A0AA39Y4S5_9PEZI|nr:hypothetical protein B0T16DRAFT_457997 [Cercophora newfieldiana]
MEACCTCATLLSAVPRFSEAEKPLPENRVNSCCGRVICGQCLHACPFDAFHGLIFRNYRFNSYCPYCQTKAPGPSVLDRDPPPYSAVVAASTGIPSPPPYYPLAATTTLQPSKNAGSSSDPEKAALAESVDGNDEPAEDTLHFLDHNHDTVTSLSLRYGVPADALRRVNSLGSDHLLAGRRTVLIPGDYYRGGVSLSPRPVEGEEEEARKAKIRRWMVACKVSDYDVAVFYLEQAGYDFDDAVEAYLADEAWERDHPMEHDGEGGQRKQIGGLSLARGKRVSRSHTNWKPGFWGKRC